MFEESAHDADHADILRFSGNPRQKAANAAYHELDFNARLTCFFKLVDDRLIRQAVHLGEDIAIFSVLCLFDLTVYVSDQAGFERFGRHKQPVIRKIRVADRDIAEKRHGVFADFLIRGDDVQVGILFARRLVIIARTEVGNVADLFAFFQHDGNDLGMYLVILHSVDDRASCLL